MEPLPDRFAKLKSKARNAALLQGCLSTTNKPEVFKFKGDVMGTYVRIIIYCTSFEQ